MVNIFRETDEERNQRLERERAIIAPNSQRIEEAVVQGIDGVISLDQFHELREKFGLHYGHRGTFWNFDKNLFFYWKKCHTSKSQEQSEKDLAIARYLTSKGVIFPKTEWISYQEENGFGLFAITRGLEVMSNEDPDSFLPFVSIDDMYDEGSYILNWIRIIDPTATKDNYPEEDHPLVALLNEAEARHRDNWGRTEEGLYYPIDVEVISLRNKECVNHNYQKIISGKLK